MPRVPLLAAPRAVTSSVAACLLLAAMAAAPAHGAFPGTNGKLAFQSQRTDNSEIYSVNPDGTGLAQLTFNSSHDSSPVWSPDGSAIAFWRDELGNAEIYAMNADGTGERNLTNSAGSDYAPAWSPDGSKVAFYSYRDGDGEIYVMNADGSGQTRLSHHAAQDWAPAWSPDGSKIAFQSDRDGNAEIYVMNADGTNQTRLTSAAGNDLDPSWSSNGAKLAFASERDGNFEIYVMNADGSGQTRLTTHSASDVRPAWSPDGAKISFDTARDVVDGPGMEPTTNNEVYVMGADGSTPVNVSADPAFDAEADWQAVAGTGNQAPTASFDHTPSSPLTGDTVSFTSTSSDPDGTIASQAWDLDNDGLYDDATGSTASRSFPTGGSYLVSLRVTDSSGAEAVTSRRVSVSNRPPAAGFELTPEPPRTGRTLRFSSSASDPDGRIVRHEWDLDGDGAFDDGDGAEVPWTYDRTGTYPVAMRATDDHGATAVANRSLTVEDGSVAVTLAMAPDAPRVAERVIFEASASTARDTSVASYRWDLDGDGRYETSTGTSPRTSRSYGDAGSLTVRVLASDAHGVSAGAERQLAIARQPGQLPPPPPSDEEGCRSELSVGSFTALASCFRKRTQRFRGRTSTYWVSSERVRLNGIDIHPESRGGRAARLTDPNGPAPAGVSVYPASKYLGAARATVRAGETELRRGSFGLSLGGRSTSLGLDGGSKIEGLEPTGTASLTPLSGGRGSLSMPVKMPAHFGGVTGDARVGIGNAAGLDITSLSVRGGQAIINRAYTLRSFNLSYDQAARGLSGAAAMVVPGPLRPALPIAFGFSGGGIPSFGPAQLATLLIGPGFNWEIASLNAQVLPPKIRGHIGFLLGPEELVAEEGPTQFTGFGMRADAEYGFPFKAPGFCPGPSLSCPYQGSWRFAGKFRLLIMGVDGNVTYFDGGKTEFDGDAQFGAAPAWTFEGKVRGTILEGKAAGTDAQAWAAGGFGRLRILGGVTLASSKFVGNTYGMAVCGETLGGLVAVGYRQRWTDSASERLGGCDVGKWLSELSPRQARTRMAASGEAFRVPAGERALVVEVEGRDAPPSVALTGPGGERIEAPDDPRASVEGQRVTVLPSPEGKLTYLLVARPAAGIWRIEERAGSSPVVAVRRASALPQPSVRARVAGRGLERKLRYRIRTVPGQRVRFREEGEGSGQELGIAAGARGTLRFTPAAGGSGKRRIVAVVEQDGLPREELAVAQYKAAIPRRLPRPRRISVRRRGARVLVSWAAVPTASRYRVLVREADGRVRMFVADRRRRKVAVRGVGKRERARISVAALNAAGEPGSTRTARVGAKRRSARGRRR